MTIFTNEHETQRLATLHKLDLLDTLPEAAFDRIVEMATLLFDLPMAAISLTDVDRQWFKSRVGIDQDSMPRLYAPCAEVVETAGTLVIEDLTVSENYCASPLAGSGVRFYAGAPLLMTNGHTLGSMCVLGYEPRSMTEREITSLNDLARLVMTQVELMHAMGRVDAVSGLPNRQQFVEDYRDRQVMAGASAGRLMVYFSVVTPEQLGSLTRVTSATYLDELVREAAATLQSGVGRRRKVYHVTATSFVFFAPDDAEEVAYIETLQRMLASYRDQAISRFVTTSAVGLARFESAVTDCYELLRMGAFAAREAALLDSRISIYSLEQNTAYQRRFKLVEDFGTALESKDQLRLVYQPRIDLQTSRCVGAEALLRWTHPTLGEISPGEFIPAIEQTPMRKPMTEWVCRTAIEQIARWRAAGKHLTVSVNIIAANLLEAGFFEKILLKLARFDVPSDCLELEVTEGSIVSNTSAAHEVLKNFARAGLHIAIDDFGTGYSSLAYLKNLPAQIVKIDQTFLRDLEEDPKNKILLATMIKMARDLGFRTVAEGLETEAMWNFVRACGCDEVQGYWIARPMEVARFSQWCDESLFGTAPLEVPETPVVHAHMPPATHPLMADLSRHELQEMVDRISPAGNTRH